MAESKEKSKLEILKERYKELKENYNLPAFEDLNREFVIEKIAELETDTLTREIRRFIADRIYNYLRFLETLINPLNAPMFVFSLVKSFNEDDKKKLSEIYSRLSEINLDLIKLDLEFTEEDDAEFIAKVYDLWKAIKRELADILKKSKISKNEKETKSDSGYFG